MTVPRFEEEIRSVVPLAYFSILDPISRLSSDLRRLSSCGNAEAAIKESMFFVLHEMIV